jgi:hypothetical protein
LAANDKACLKQGSEKDSSANSDEQDGPEDKFRLKKSQPRVWFESRIHVESSPASLSLPRERLAESEHTGSQTNERQSNHGLFKQDTL